MMIFKGRVMRWIAGLLAGMAVSLVAAEFAPPAEGPLAFRRDKIPLDVEAMAALSKQLEAMAREWRATTAPGRRGAAQMLALAMALDPANTGARELLAAYQKNHRQPAANPEHLASNRTEIARYIAWLQAPAAGSNGQALAACLQDVVTMTDPKHPEMNEKGAWAGWIPSLAAYEPKVVVKMDEPQTPLAAVKPDPTSTILLSKAQVHTLLWHKVGNDESSNWALACAPLQMSAIKVDENPDGGDDPFSIAIGSPREAGRFASISTTVQNLLRQQHEKLPPGYRITITSTELAQSIQSRKLQTISAAVAVLASSAITGREPEAIIIGQIDAAGTFKLPLGFWDQLQSLGKGNGQRLVLPVDAAAYLPSLLALEKPEFFLEYEVLLAADFNQMLDLTAKAPPATLAAATAQFREVRARLGTQDLRQYIANRFVRQHLAEILQQAPCHDSANMLLLQAAGKRPTLVARTVLAAELRRAIEPMNWLVMDPAAVNADNDPVPSRNLPFEFTTAEISKLSSTFEICRTRIDGLERYAEKDDRELVEHTRKVINVIRLIVKATRSRGDLAEVAAAVRSLTSLHQELSEQLAAEAGDGPAPRSQIPGSD